MNFLQPCRAYGVFRTSVPAFQFQFQVRLLKHGHYAAFDADFTQLYRRSVIPVTRFHMLKNETVSAALCGVSITRMDHFDNPPAYAGRSSQTRSI